MKRLLLLAILVALALTLSGCITAKEIFDGITSPILII